MTIDKKNRWQYRFDNYNSAVKILKEALNLMDTRGLTDLEKEGLIQRFEFTWELAWKLINDYLISEGKNPEIVTPKSVIRGALTANIIKNGDIWFKSIDDRNITSHTYDIKILDDIINNIKHDYIKIFIDLHDFMTKHL